MQPEVSPVQPEVSFTTVTPPPPDRRNIPGRLTDKEAQALFTWCFGRKVLQVGCYCGKSLIQVASAAEHVWVVDNFAAYPGGWSAVAGEAMASVQGAGVDDRIDLLFYGGPELMPKQEATTVGVMLATVSLLPDFDTVYVDPDWPNQEEAQDWALENLPRGGRLIYHANGDIRQMTV